MWLQLLRICSLLILPTVVARSGTVKCGGNWQQLNDKCFLVVSGSNMKWADARQDCRTRSVGGDLAIIPNQATANLLLSILSGVSTQYWIGLHAMALENTWKWIDDETPTDKGYENWSSEEPINAVSEDCGTFNPSTATGEWSDAECNQIKPYICERNVTNLPRCDETRGWRGHNGKCYQFFDNVEAWQDAESLCGFLKGGHLAHIKSPEDQAFLDNLQVTHGSSYWIGLKDKEGGQDGQYQWSDQSAFDAATSFSMWGSDQPQNQWYGTEGDCASVSTQGLWEIKQCTHRNTYVCEIAEGTCAPGWSLFNGKCFQVNSLTLKTWTDAKYFCEAQLAYLVDITSDAENNIVKDTLSNLNINGIDKIFIGISDLETDNQFVWAVNGEPIDTGGYSNWAPGQPGAVAGQKECGYIQAADVANASWWAGDCFMLGAFICETTAGAKVLSVPADHDSGSCDDPAWDLHKDYCYEFFKERKTWADADAACKASGAELISIHDDDVQSFMSARINVLEQRLWMGLNDKETQGIFVWTDGTPFDYNNWAPGESNGGDCVAMLPWTKTYGLWKTRSCTEQIGYVCKKKSTGPKPTSSPPTSGPNPSSSPPKGLSGGAIVGIIIGVLAAVILALGLGYFLWRNRRAKQPAGTATSFENVACTLSANDVTSDTTAGMSVDAETY